MSVNVRDTVTSDGRRFERMLRELAEKEVRVGFQQGENSDGRGVDMVDIAAWNELGTEHSPARPFLRKSVDENEAKIINFLKEKKDQP